jgi:hypothetical protein
MVVEKEMPLPLLQTVRSGKTSVRELLQLLGPPNAIVRSGESVSTEIIQGACGASSPQQIFSLFPSFRANQPRHRVYCFCRTTSTIGPDYFPYLQERLSDRIVYVLVDEDRAIVEDWREIERRR